jgi:hypothetical protein
LEINQNDEVALRARMKMQIQSLRRSALAEGTTTFQVTNPVAGDDRSPGATLSEKLHGRLSGFR